MPLGIRRHVLMLGVLAAIALPACGDSDVQSPAENSVASSVSGTVVSDETGSPLPAVGVVLEYCEPGMMAQRQWRHSQSMKTDAEGHFHFEYLHRTMHSYRVGIDGMRGAQGQCYLDGGAETGVVLRVLEPNP